MIYWGWLIPAIALGMIIGGAMGVNATLDWILKKLEG